jgi:hypothetical protein
MWKRNLQKAGQELHGKRQPLPGKSCLSAKLAKSTSRLFCDVCNVAWMMLCKIWRKSLKKHLANALCEVGMACAVYFAKRGKSP